MFKSVFTKYITAFMLIIAISFMILALILCQMVTNYSDDTKTQMVERTADTIAGFVNDGYRDEGSYDFSQYIYFSRNTVQPFVSAMTELNEDIIILVSDANGGILLTADKSEPGYINSNVSIDIMSKLSYSGKQTVSSDLGGVFTSKHLVRAIPIYDADGIFVGAIFVCSPLQEFDQLIETMIKTIIMSCLWVMLAALLAVYFISEKIIDPLKQMSKAAKNFAAGKFDVRIPVKGRDEVAELATAFNNMAASLANLEDMRRTFLANVSHDLRTPMTTISGFIDGIIDGAIPPEKHEYYLDVIRTEIRRLSRLVISLLDITRIQAGERKFNKTAFDICEMARLILISFEQKLDAKKLDVEFECVKDKMIVYADRDAIYQILYNICDNAIKFSRDGGKYRISILEKDRKVYISVFNEGIGIPAEELPFVFERFYKSDKSRGLDKTGVGLGLYIAKTIIDAHEEEIWVKSVYGENCEFVFTLPYTPEATVVVKD
ncbi:MAG: cell wall metabolism sensor histidine kinase WalK [Clostridiales bacterium]|nr:cell wall metabolism sensor histidine kinase WalK [Clostridiales bacterium]